MLDGRDSLPERDERKKEEQGQFSRLVYLAPLLSLILQFLEFLLKIIGVVR